MHEVVVERFKPGVRIEFAVDRSRPDGDSGGDPPAAKVLAAGQAESEASTSTAEVVGLRHFKRTFGRGSGRQAVEQTERSLEGSSADETTADQRGGDWLEPLTTAGANHVHL